MNDRPTLATVWALILTTGPALVSGAAGKVYLSLFLTTVIFDQRVGLFSLFEAFAEPLNTNQNVRIST